MKILAGIILVLIFILVPALARGLLRAANIMIWMLPLQRRIGPVPREAFIPDDVKAGLDPLGVIGIFVLVIGLICLWAGYAWDLGGLYAVGAVLAGIPGFYLLLLLMAAVWSGELTASTDKMSEKKLLERQNQEASISTLSQWIEEKRDDATLRAAYYPLWRACHRIDEIRKVSLIEESPLDESLVNLVKTDICAALASPAADAKLIKEAGQKQHEIDSLVAIIKKEPTDILPQNAIEKVLGSRFFGVPAFAVCVFLAIRAFQDNEGGKSAIEIIVFYLLAIIVASIHAKCKRNEGWFVPLACFWLPPIGIIAGFVMLVLGPTKPKAEVLPIVKTKKRSG